METSLNIWWGALFWTAQLLIVGHGIGVNEGHAYSKFIDKGDVDSMPEYVYLNVTLRGKSQFLTLEKNSDFNLNFPMFVLEADDTGKPIVQEVKTRPAKVYAPYSNADHSASVLVFREKDEDGTSHLSVEGVVAEDNGEVVKLKSQGRDGTSAEFQSRDSQNSSERVWFPVQVLENLSFLDDKRRRKSQHTRKRPKRNDKRVLNIDIIALADYGMYKRFLGDSNDRAETLAKLKAHYVNIFNGMSNIYKEITTIPYTFNVLFTGLLVATTALASKWTESSRRADSPMDIIETQKTLDGIIAWIGSRPKLPAHDYVIFFTGYDLARERPPGTFHKGERGIAATSALCSDTHSFALVEDSGTVTYWIAAHELGHGLGANHDGENNNCKASDNYIMAAFGSPRTQIKFSNCTLASFETELRTLTQRFPDCLYNTKPALADVVIMSGSTRSPDEQCKTKFGSSATFCRDLLANPSEICKKIECKPHFAPKCLPMLPETGTSCGNKRWCANFACVDDDRAPEVDEACVFGDLPGSNCKSKVSPFVGICYNDTFRSSNCCETCGQYKRRVQECEYGDRIPGCNANQCNSSAISYRKSCCGACNYGTPFTTTTRMTTITISSTTSGEGGIFSTTQISIFCTNFNWQPKLYHVIILTMVLMRMNTLA